jgi:predicted amidophosphoribosyltransferase
MQSSPDIPMPEPNRPNSNAGFCRYCGKSISSNSAFCRYCGKKLNQ